MIKLFEYLLTGLLGTLAALVLPTLTLLIANWIKPDAEHDDNDASVVGALRNHIYEQIIQRGGR